MTNPYLISKADLAQLALYAHEFRQAITPTHGRTQKARALVIAKEAFQYLDNLELQECAQDTMAGVVAGAASGLQNQEPADNTSGAGFDSLPGLDASSSTELAADMTQEIADV